uniref:Putative capsid VP1 n=1 Tax=uncultured virus TaxID=340016 RepID=A0A1D8MK84_9VIRU|nr:putative capsid VP1 [uncultured virus]
MMSMNMGQLVPLDWIEVLPGDHFRHDATALIRTQPLLAPLMHKVQAKIFHFFVPNRLLWDNWEPFITGGPDGMNASVHPYVTGLGLPGPSDFQVGTLWDYLGLPPLADAETLQVSALPFRAYSKIVNDYFVDQDLLTPLPMALTDGSDTTTNTEVFAPAWKKDYFTMARPEPSKGPDVTAPVNGLVGTVSGDGTVPKIAAQSTPGDLRNLQAITSQGVSYSGGAITNGSNLIFGEQAGLEISDTGTLNVNALDLREMFATLRFQELRSRFGSKYVDYLAYLGVKSDDARLQRAEYLGGGMQPLQFSEVLQTAPQDVDDPVGALKGHGISAKRTNRYRKYFQEHGIVMTLMYVMPEPVYSNAVERSWLRTTKEMYWQPEYEHIGQQTVPSVELNGPLATDPDEVVGWIDRYEEYRTPINLVSGEFRPGNSLDYWTMARGWETEATINGDFITGNPTNRVWPATNAQQLYVMVSRNLKARRKVTANPKGYVY